MIPWGGMVAAAAAVAINQRTKSASPDNPPWYVIVGFLLVPVLFLAALAGAGGVFGWLSAALLVFLLFPWTVAQRVCVPLGAVKTAYWLGTASDTLFSRDYRGGGALAGARALFFAPVDKQPALRVWLEGRIARHSPLRGASVVAVALLDISAGRVKEGRALLRLVDRLHDAVTPPTARALAAEWLALDALEQGDWSVAVTLCAGTLKRTALTRLLAAVGTRVQPAGTLPAAGALTLWWRWWRAPHKARTLPWVRRALESNAAARVGVEDPHAARHAHFDAAGVPPEGKTHALATAVAHHAWVNAQSPQRLATGELERLMAAWDAALADPNTRAWATERAFTLQAHGDAAALKALEDQVVEELVMLARAHVLPVGEPQGHGVAGRVAWDVRNGLLGEVETAVGRLAQRAADDRALPSADEWRAWNALRMQVDGAVAQGGENLARLLFPTLQDKLGDHAVWLWNKRKERVLAHDIFKWLRDLARQVGDERAAELQEKNVACGV